MLTKYPRAEGEIFKSLVLSDQNPHIFSYEAIKQEILWLEKLEPQNDWLINNFNNESVIQLVGRLLD